MAEPSVYGAMHRTAKNLLLFVLTAIFASGCYFEVSTDLDNASGTRTAEELAGLWGVT